MRMAAVIEKECIYVKFTGLTFSSVEAAPSQNADRIISAIKHAFHKHNIYHLFEKCILLCSDGTGVNSGASNGVTAML